MAFGLSPDDVDPKILASSTFKTPPKSIDPAVDLSPPSMIRQRAVGIDLTPPLGAKIDVVPEDSLFARADIFQRINRSRAGEIDTKSRLVNICKGMKVACDTDDPMRLNLLPTIARGVCISLENLYEKTDFSDKLVILKNEIHDAFVKIEYETEEDLEVLRLTMLGFVERLMACECECD